MAMSNYIALFRRPAPVMIMEENMQTGIIKLKNAPSIVSFAAIGGKKEAEGHWATNSII